jgi:hypothetical protein
MLASIMKRLLILALLPCLVAQAQTPEVLPPVATELKRDSSAMPYAQMNELLAKLKQHGEGLVRMDFKVDRDKSKIPLDQLRMAIASEEAYLPIAVDAEGAFALPILPQSQAKTADLASNAAKGQLAIRGTLELNVRPEELDMAKVRQIMRVAHKLKSELLPWYVRWLFPRIEGVRVCADTPGFELEWRENGQLLGLPLPAGERDPETRKGQASRPCTLLTGAERWPDAARLVPPPGAKLGVKIGD